jgi:uncharacterized protein (TIGR00730 family)
VSARSDGAPAAVASVCLFCGSSVGARPVYADAARELGRQLASDGVTLVYGGGSVGLMNEAANATLEAGGRVVGVITEALKAREVGHLGLTELHVVATMHQRKALMAQRSDAFVVLPGGYGTLDELCEMLTWDQLGIHAKPIVVVNLEGFFDGLLAQLARAIDDGLLKPEHRALLVVVDRVDEVPAAMRGWQPPTAAKEWRAHAPRP